MTAKGSRSVNVFFGHQFVSAAQSKTELRTVVASSLKRAATDWNAREKIKIKASFNQLALSSGQDLFTQVLAAIDNSDICVFDLSEKNNNVIFELGHANGRKKEIIWICDETNPISSLPSDFQGRFVLRYEDADDLAGQLETELLSKINAVVRGLTEERAFREVWDLDQAKCVDLVFGKIPEEERSKFANAKDPNFLRYQAVADIDTLVQLSRFLSRTFPRVEQSDFTPSEFRKDIDCPLFAVGGPAWNTVARRYYGAPSHGLGMARLPLSFVEDEKTGEETIQIHQHDGSSKFFKVDNIAPGVVCDVGVFARFFDRQNHVPVFLISGIRTGGVLGAARVLSDNSQGRRNCQYLGSLDKDLSEFLIVFRVLCRIDQGEMIVETPNLNDETILYLDDLSKRSTKI